MDGLGFKFNIGDVVRYLGCHPDPNQIWLGVDKEMRLRIVERWLQECPGGVQRSYRVRPFDRRGGFDREYTMLNECELESSSAFEPLPEPQAK